MPVAHPEEVRHPSQLLALLDRVQPLVLRRARPPLARRWHQQAAPLVVLLSEGARRVEQLAADAGPLRRLQNRSIREA